MKLDPPAPAGDRLLLESNAFLRTASAHSRIVGAHGTGVENL